MAISPVTETGFFYDFDCPVSITPDDLGKIEAEMRRIIKLNLPVIREEVDREDIRAEITSLNEPYKLEILNRICDDEIITRYYIGSPEGRKVDASLFIAETLPPKESWWDLCAGPHVNSTHVINSKAFALLNVAAYIWYSLGNTRTITSIFKAEGRSATS